MAPGFNNYLPPPKPGVIPLRPLGLGEILDGAFQAARRNGKAMFGSALIFQLATVAVTMAVMFIIFGRFMTDIFDMESSLQSNDPAAMEALGGGLLTLSLSMLLTGFLAVLIQMVLQGALVVPVLRSVLNRKTSFGQMWRLTKPRVGSLLLLAVLYAVATVVAVAAYAAIVVGLIVALDPQDSGSAILGVIALSLLLSLPFVVLAVWIGTKVLLAPAAIVVENVGAIAGIKRSWQLTKRNWWRTFGTSFLAALIAGIIGGVITTPVSMLVSFVMPLMLGSEPTTDQTITVLLISQALTSIVSAVVGAVTLAFQTGVMALIYVDLRMRRDGFDIALLKESETGKDDGGIPGSPVPGALVSENSAPYGNTTYGNSNGTTGVETPYQPGNYGS
ncbi:DUF7847 domain-containing protein [Arthrobacter antibioticus]|uniref:DUF7847 domain-containing protein n=1 Tax=Arthrobacter sp. H35-MC1 TaxID=3046203 RepID=UPI0024B9E623|nr:hypothetical protein [Arthrobacter sp. H35-MC1]MDJ0316509.1 hypothetical protein [Arthrobacter sp. H35-MC1]